MSVYISTRGNSVYFESAGYSWHDSGDEAIVSIARLREEERITSADAAVILEMVERKRRGGPGEEFTADEPPDQDDLKCPHCGRIVHPAPTRCWGCGK